VARLRIAGNHTIAFSGDIDDYALVFFEGLDVRAIVVFRRETLTQVCAALRKRHPNQETTVQITQTNFNELISDPEEFASLGVTCYLPGE